MLINKWPLPTRRLFSHSILLSPSYCLNATAVGNFAIRPNKRAKCNAKGNDSISRFLAYKSSRGKNLFRRKIAFSFNFATLGSVVPFFLFKDFLSNLWKTLILVLRRLLPIYIYYTSIVIWTYVYISKYLYHYGALYLRCTTRPVRFSTFFLIES